MLKSDRNPQKLQTIGDVMSGNSARCRLKRFGIVFAFLIAGCVTEVQTPTVGSVDSQAPVAASGDSAGVATPVRPAAYPDPDNPPSLPDEAVPLFRAGDTNALELPVDAALAEAYEAYFRGDGEQALDALDRSVAESPLARFHLGAQRMRTLIMMGRAADAEAMTTDVAALERAAMGTDVNAFALRAEARLWLSDYDGAELDALRVAQATQAWILPSSYGGAPTNMAEIVLLTTAQLRSYTILAGLNLLRGDAAAARPWADAAERGFATVHQVADHMIYGAFLKPYPESYYGRAFNLLFRGASTALTTQDVGAGAQDMAAARAFFDAIGYRAGMISAAAIESWTLYELDQDRDRALDLSEQAVQLAIDAGFPDFVWRISALRGEMLIDEGRMDEAESAFRRADASVDLVSGALASDRAKLRYGVGKETISYRLSQFNLARGDLDQLFTDLEQARARAFVDMLADRPVAPGRQSDLVATIRGLDEQIRSARVRALAPVDPSPADAARLQDLLRERENAIAALRSVDPDLADVHGASVASLDGIRAVLADGDRIAYALPARGDDPIRFLMVEPAGARIHTAGMTASDLNRTLLRFREAVRTRRDGRQVETANLIAELFNMPALAADGTLYVVPTGDLFFMPWGALPGSGHVVVLPTGDWLLRQIRSGTRTAIGLLGDPNFGGDLPQLDGARAEVQSLGSLLGADPLMAAQATPDALRNQVGGGARVLHIATHGAFDAEQPLQSAIYLTDGQKSVALTAAEIFADPLPADLVVLSACETGMGTAVAGDDFLGLARSFFLGGAGTVVNSLWPISDAGTRRYMEVFHQTILVGGNPVHAWAQARDTLRAEGYPPSVYGAFILTGGG